MKKAFRWLDDHHIAYTFHDYKKDGAPESVLTDALSEHGWDIILNKRGTTWRQLPDNIKNNMDQDRAFETATQSPSIIKRPLLSYKGKIIVGFDASIYENVFL